MRRGPFFLPGVIAMPSDWHTSRRGNLVLAVLPVVLGQMGGLPCLARCQLGSIPFGLGGLVGFAHCTTVVAVLATNDVGLCQLDVRHHGQDDWRPGRKGSLAYRASGI